MTPSAEPPPALQVVQRQTGHGEAATLGGRYPLGALTFVRAPNGRGLVSLEAGSGRLDLAGGEADDLGGGRWRLHIDRMSLLQPKAIAGTCDLTMGRSPTTYAALDCHVGATAASRIEVRWRGDGSPAVTLR